MATRYRASYKGIGEMLRSPEMQAHMRGRAEKVKAAAAAAAPRRTGTYASSFEVSSGVRESGRTRRAYGRVTNTDPKARWLEYGTGPGENGLRTPRFRTLGKALDAAGD